MAKEAQDEENLVEAHKLLSTVYGAFLLGQRSEDTHHLCGGRYEGISISGGHS